MILAEDNKTKATSSKPKSTTTKKVATKSKPTTATKSKPKTTTKTTSRKPKPKAAAPVGVQQEAVTPVADVVVEPKKQTKKKKSKSTKPKEPKVMTSEGIIKQQAVSEAFKSEKKVVFEKKKGKRFYLIISLLFYAGAYFYIGNIFSDNTYIETALFAFAALFVLFLLIQLNIHMMFINFFVLPFKFLFTQARLETTKDVIIDPTKKGIKRQYIRYRAIFTITVYLIILLLLVGSQIVNGILDGDLVMVIITQSSLTAIVFLIIVCSWQYLFNIIPSILDKSIDAKNGFILTLSAIVIIIYVIFMVFNINYLSEMMIFVLIIGFIALLGVNLNMIVGEINIFSNLRSKKSKTVTRVVFLIFFGFHLYVILYASVVAFSIYSWNPDTYNFNNTKYEYVVYEDVNDFNGTPITTVYDQAGNLITTVYDSVGNEITNFYNEDGELITEFYDASNQPIWNFYPDSSGFNPITEVEKDGVYYYQNNITYKDGSIVAFDLEALPHTYGDFLYYTVVTVSTVGYGDITPNTNYALAKSWGAFLGIYGFSFFALSIGFVSNIAIEGATERKDD